VKAAERRLRKAILATSLVGLLGIVVLAACSNQGEGERCDHLNGDDDCKTDEGLICYEAKFLNQTNSDRCCPKDRSQAREAVCQTPVSIVGNDAQAPADTGPSTTAEASVSDAGDAASSDASDASDAPNDG